MMRRTEPVSGCRTEFALSCGEFPLQNVTTFDRFPFSSRAPL